MDKEMKKKIKKHSSMINLLQMNAQIPHARKNSLLEINEQPSTTEGMLLNTNSRPYDAHYPSYGGGYDDGYYGNRRPYGRVSICGRQLIVCCYWRSGFSPTQLMQWKLVQHYACRCVSVSLIIPHLVRCSILTKLWETLSSSVCD
uniref:Ovule protein n=1 Tax=Ascaris lumbricoides TaxID=6252 RepID=A0A0M3HPC3_ASCLU